MTKAGESHVPCGVHRTLAIRVNQKSLPLLQWGFFVVAVVVVFCFVFLPSEGVE